MAYGYCVYHGVLCDYEGDYNCIDCPHNTEEDVEWFKRGIIRFVQGEEQAKSENKETET